MMAEYSPKHCDSLKMSLLCKALEPDYALSVEVMLEYAPRQVLLKRYAIHTTKVE